MPGTVDRVVKSDVVDTLYGFVNSIVDRNGGHELNVVAIDFMDEFRNELAKAAVPEYATEKNEDGTTKYGDNNEPIFKLDTNGAKIPEKNENGRPKLLVPMAKQYKLSIDGLNAVWLIIKDFITTKAAASDDIISAKVLCISFGMTKRWASISSQIEVPVDDKLDGIFVEVPVD